MNIPFNKIYFTGKELNYIEDAMLREQIAGDGYYTKIVSSYLECEFGIKKVLMTTSATHALEISSMLIGLGPGDEVIMPSFTFPSTANAVMLQGATPVFAEIKENTLNIDPYDIEKKITPKTRAIMPVHYGGVTCDMDEIMSISQKYNLYVIEDAAQGVNSKYKNKYLGTIGHLGCYSFHGTKNYVSGEGGAIAINIDDSNLIERAEIIRQKGTNRNKFLIGEIDKYSWVDIGSSYIPSDILMAILYAQIQELDSIKSKREHIYRMYFDSLSDCIDNGILRGVSQIPKDCSSNYHLFYLLLESESIKDKMLSKLKKLNINATTHFQPLHSSYMGQKLGYQPFDLPLTENLSRSLIRLPLYSSMTEEESLYVIQSIEKTFKEF